MRTSAGSSHTKQRSSAAGRTGPAVFAAIAFGFVAYAFLAPATYRATATLSVEPSSSAPTSWPEPLQAAARLRARLLEPELLRRIARGDDSAPSASEKTLSERIGASLRVEAESARRFIVSAASSSPADAQRVASEFAQNGARYAAAILGEAPGTAEPSVRASFVRAPLPSSPERPNRLLVVVIGLIIGLVWGAGAALGTSYWEAHAAQRRRRATSRAVPEPDSAPFSNPQAGAVRELVAEVLRPRGPATAQASVSAQAVPVGWKPDPSLSVSARRGLCEDILPFVADGCFVIGVTAVPEVHVHKSRVASELALALAEPDQPRVLLLDADFHSPDLHRVLGVHPSETGSFSDQLRSRGRDDTDVPWQVIDCGRSLHLIVESAKGSPGMLLSTQFGEAIRSLRTYYDLIVINGPLTSNELDCRVLEAVVDGVIVASTQADSPYLSQALAIFKRQRFSKVVEA